MTNKVGTVTGARVRDCYGFDDTGPIDLKTKNAHRLFYLLGRNGSGKTSLLTALSFMSPDHGHPPDNTRFKNFNGDLEGIVSVAVDRIPESWPERLKKNISKIANIKSGPVADWLESSTNAFSEFLDTGPSGPIWIHRRSDSTYSLSFEAAECSNWEDLRELVHEKARTPFPKVAKERTTELERAFVSTLLPEIYFFRAAFATDEDLPERIALNGLSSSNRITTALLRTLGSDDVRRFLETEDPQEGARLLEEMGSRAEELRKRVNASTRSSDERLLGINLSSKGGLQITFYTDEKPSYHRQLSNSTQLLLAYHLVTSPKSPVGGVILFDEPTQGFHPSAESQALRFLLDLSRENTVLVATHSQHLIDTSLINHARLLTPDGARTRITHAFQRANDRDKWMALEPVHRAIGLPFVGGLSLERRIVVLEGVTDLIYLRAFETQLKREASAFAPLRGDGTAGNFLPLLISQGVEFKVVLDKGHPSVLLKESFDLKESHIFMVGGKDRSQGGIEDIFSKADFEILLNSATIGTDDQFPHKPSSAWLPDGDKRLVARTALDLASAGKLELDQETRNNLTALFEFIESDEWYSGP